jgi:hypothetical protein
MPSINVLMSMQFYMALVATKELVSVIWCNLGEKSTGSYDGGNYGYRLMLQYNMTLGWACFTCNSTGCKFSITL